jgi:hypothetical protein
MAFWLGSHMPHWLEHSAVPLFISHRRLVARRRLPRALGVWALDSGAFSEIAALGHFETSPRAYAAAVDRYAAEIGGLAWAAIQDWMCEPFMTAKTGLTVGEHQRRTVGSYLDLCTLAPHLPWVPVLQGFTLTDYERCIDLYRQAGIDLVTLPLVGLGSVCRRQATTEITALVTALAGYGLRLHGFGVKTGGLHRYGPLLGSADSMAWSYAARHQPPLPGCTTHANCANCLRFALAWRAELACTLTGWRVRPAVTKPHSAATGHSPPFRHAPAPAAPHCRPRPPVGPRDTADPPAAKRPTAPDIAPPHPRKPGTANGPQTAGDRGIQWGLARVTWRPGRYRIAVPWPVWPAGS